MIHDIDTIHSQILASKVDAAKKIDPSEEAALKDACAGFEAILTKTLMDSMRQTLPGDALFPDSNGKDIFESMYDQSLSDHISQAPTAFGLKEFLFNQLKPSLK